MGLLPSTLLEGKEHLMHLPEGTPPSQQGDCELQMRMFMHHGIETTSYYSTPLHKLSSNAQTVELAHKGMLL